MAASDGHTIAIIRRDGSALQHDTQPRLDHLLGVLPNHNRVGALYDEALEGLRQLPKSWCNLLALGRTSELECFRRVGKKDKERKIHIFKGEARGIALEELRPSSLGIDVTYLLRAFDFCRTVYVYVWAGNGDTDPIYFTPTQEHPRDCRRFAIVMPVKL